MEATVARVEAQLKLLSSKIEHLVARSQIAGVPARFDTLMHIDELKALHAIGLAQLTAYKAADGTKQARIRDEMERSWNDVENAVKRRLP